MRELISKAQARAAGLTRYFTGKPCCHGHTCERMVSSGGCVICVRAKKHLWNLENRARTSASRNAWAAKNRERCREIKNAWNAKNKEAQAARSRKWFLANKAKANEATRRYQAKHPEKGAAHEARRRAMRTQLLPKWADKQLINNIYVIAKEFRAHGFDVEVDHIVPLCGKNVTGLHVHQNLQIIPKTVNRSKSNRFGTLH